MVTPEAVLEVWLGVDHQLRYQVQHLAEGESLSFRFTDIERRVVTAKIDYDVAKGILAKLVLQGMME